MINNIGNGSMPLRFGRLINTKVYGGPFRDCPDYMFGVKMASEIDVRCDVSIPTEDFSVPIVSQLQEGIVRALMAMMTGQTVYAGCMGGIGRTGIFLAALAKVQIEYRKIKHRAGRGDDPVRYVRKHFIPNALENDAQIKYIADLDVASIVSWLNATQVAMGLGGITPARPVDADCVTLPNGDCVAEVECMHGPAIDEFGDTDSADSENLQLQIMKLEERVDMLHGSLIDSVEVMKLMNREHKALTKNVGDLIHATQIGFQEVLTKQTWREKIKVWWESH